MSEGDRLDTESVGAHIEGLLDQLGTVAGEDATGIAEEIVRELMALYGAGLGRILQLARAHCGESLRAALADDGLVAGLLALHDLHPVDLRRRVEAAMSGLREHLRSRGMDVELASIDGDLVRLRFSGPVGGCGSSQATLVGAIEQAIARTAPEIARVEATEADQVPQLIPAESLTLRRDLAGLEGGGRR